MSKWYCDVVKTLFKCLYCCDYVKIISLHRLRVFNKGCENSGFGSKTQVQPISSWKSSLGLLL